MSSPNSFKYSHLRIAAELAEQFEKSIAGKTFNFIFRKNNKSIDSINVHFHRFSFLHLIGLQSNYCLNNTYSNNKNLDSLWLYNELLKYKSTNYKYPLKINKFC